MDTYNEKIVQVYDNATGEHYTRPCTPDELAFYEQLAQQSEATSEPVEPPQD